MTPPDPRAAKAEQLASGLKQSLRRRRFRPALIILGLLLLAGVALGAMLWSLYQDRAEVPTLQVLALDGFVQDTEKPRVRARLVAPDMDRPPRLSGHDVVFLTSAVGGKESRQEKTTTDSQGFAEAPWPLPPETTQAEFLVRHIDVRRRKGSNDGGRLFVWPGKTPVLLVDVAEVLADPGQPVPPAAPPAQAEAAAALDALKKDVHVVYLTAGAETWQRGRQLRGWVVARFAAQPALPPGPVLGRPDFAGATTAADVRRAAVEALRRHGDARLHAVTSHADTVPLYRELGVRPTWLGAEAPPADIPKAATWAEVPDVLRAELEKK